MSIAGLVYPPTPNTRSAPCDLRILSDCHTLIGRVANAFIISIGRLPMNGFALMYCKENPSWVNTLRSMPRVVPTNKMRVEGSLCKNSLATAMAG